MKTSMSHITKGLFSRFRIRFRVFYRQPQAAFLINNHQLKKTAFEKSHFPFNKKLLEVYLFYPYLNGRRERRGDFKNFFRKLNNIDIAISGQPIFLDSQHALRYSRFMGDTHGILKAYVVERAIEGSGQELLLKRGYLTKESIHGCYPGWAQGAYFENPEFNEKTV